MSTPSGLGYAEFADRVGSGFALQLPSGDHIPVVLTECASQGPGCFSLLFKAGPGAPIEQAIYPLSADGFGPEPVFLVPVARRPNDSQFPLEYQAIFNSAAVPEPLPEQTGSTHHFEEEAR